MASAGGGSCRDVLTAMLTAWFQALSVESPHELAWVGRWAQRYAQGAGGDVLATWWSGLEPGPVAAEAGRAALHGVYLAVCERLGPGVADRTLGKAIEQGEAIADGRCRPRDLL